MRVWRLATAIWFGVTGAAYADGSGAQPEPAPSRARVFLISPEESQQSFMCETGRLQSLLPTAIAEHRVVSVTLLDQTKSAIPDGIWTSAYGFRLTHKQTVIISVVMICGN